jgi:hypothetical protein
MVALRVGLMTAGLPAGRYPRAVLCPFPL